MNKWFFVSVTVLVLAFGYYMMRKLDVLIQQNQRIAPKDENRTARRIRIAAEQPDLLDDISAALNCCSETIPYMEFLMSYGTRNRLLHRLSEGSLDIVLLTEKSAEGLPAEYRTLRIRSKKQKDIPSGDPAVTDANDGGGIVVIWNKTISSKDRDRVIFMIENEHCILTSGYRDYLN